MTMNRRMERLSYTGNRIKWLQFAALLTSSGLLFRSGMDASFSNLLVFHPNRIAETWGNLETATALLLFPTAFSILSNSRRTGFVAIALGTVAVSFYAAQ